MRSTAFRLGQRLAALGLLDLAGAREQRIEIAIFIDELRGGLDADAFRARHIVGGIARERLHVDDLVRRHAEIVDDFLFADEALLARAFRAGRRRPDRTSRRRGPMSCIRSLSAETISTSAPLARACVA